MLPGVKKDKTAGIRTTHWFWGAMSALGGAMKEGPKREKKPKAECQQKQADAASAQPQAVRARESGPIRFVSRVREADAKAGEAQGSRFRCVLLREGLGNFRDGFYYTRQALESAVPIFEGKKIYADHPALDEEQTRPERSVRDVLGHFENVSTAVGEDGQTMLEADCVVIPDKSYDWARAQMSHAVAYAKKYPDKDFIGLSINADGFSDKVATEAFIKEHETDLPKPCLDKLREAMSQGVDQIRVADKFETAVSCDLVTEPGAGGKILTMMERNKHMEKKEAEGQALEQKDAGHEDVEKDKELIKAMLKKHLGEEEEPSEETEKAAHEAYQAALEAGHKSEEACEMVGKSMKMAKIMQARQAKQAEADKAKEAEAKKEADAKQAEADKAKEAEASKEAGKVQESAAKSAEAELLKVKGELAAMKEANHKRELAEYLDEKLAKSELPRAVTKKFKEGLKAYKSKAEIDEKFSLFLEGYGAKGGEADEFSYILGAEKTVADAKDTVSFADCAE